MVSREVKLVGAIVLCAIAAMPLSFNVVAKLGGLVLLGIGVPLAYYNYRQLCSPNPHQSEVDILSEAGQNYLNKQQEDVKQHDQRYE